MTGEHGLTISDEAVFNMIRQTAEDSKIARHRTFTIKKKLERMQYNQMSMEKKQDELAKKQDEMGEQLEEIQECVDENKQRISVLETTKCEDGKQCNEDITITKDDKTKMMKWLKWGLIIGGIIIGAVISFIGGDIIGTGGGLP